MITHAIQHQLPNAEHTSDYKHTLIVVRVSHFGSVRRSPNVSKSSFVLALSQYIRSLARCNQLLARRPITLTNSNELKTKRTQVCTKVCALWRRAFRVLPPDAGRWQHGFECEIRFLCDSALVKEPCLLLLLVASMFVGFVLFVDSLFFFCSFFSSLGFVPSVTVFFLRVDVRCSFKFCIVSTILDLRRPLSFARWLLADQKVLRMKISSREAR